MSNEPKKTKLSVIIPVYNEEKTIFEVVQRVCAVDLGQTDKEVIISDDGSCDETPREIEKARCAHPQTVRVHTSRENSGKGAAVRLGISMATGDILLIQDADLELDPSEYLRILDPIVAQKAKVVYGSRFMVSRSHLPVHTRAANRFLTWLTNLLFCSRLTDMETAYKAFRRDVLVGIQLRCSKFDFEPEITAKILRAGHHISEVPVTFRPRTKREGKKIDWIDGLQAVWTLLRCRFLDQD